jgi:hypothetical protein
MLAIAVTAGTVSYLAVGLLACLWAHGSARFDRVLDHLSPLQELAILATWPVALPVAYLRFRRRAR